MNNSKLPQEIAHAWAAKVDEELSSEGIYKDECHSTSSLAEWRLPFHEVSKGARLTLSAQSVAGKPSKVTLSWQVRVFNPFARSAAAHCCACLPLGTVDAADLSLLVAAALDETDTIELASWVLGTYSAGAAVPVERNIPHVRNIAQSHQQELCDA